MRRIDTPDPVRTRRLTVGRVADGLFHPTRSSLKLAGDWLTRLGYHIGDVVEITEREGSLIVRNISAGVQ